jgi:hypothetical protein
MTILTALLNVINAALYGPCTITLGAPSATAELMAF